MHSFRTERNDEEEKETMASEKKEKENCRGEGSKGCETEGKEGKGSKGCDMEGKEGEGSKGCETEGKEGKSSQSSHHATSNPNTKENRYKEVRRSAELRIRSKIGSGFKLSGKNWIGIESIHLFKE